jgi:cytochrome c-type biogenesis protein CcmH/NrfG
VGKNEETERQLLLLGLLVSGVLFTGAVAAGTLVLLGRYAKTRAKLQQLHNPEQASKDYQVMLRH